MRRVKYKKGDEVGRRKVIENAVSLGGHHYIWTVCLDCGAKQLMHQEALKKKKRCRYCYRQAEGSRFFLNGKPRLYTKRGLV